MNGKKPTSTAIITGANSGLGYQCAKAIAGSQDWHVVVASRDRDRNAAAVKRLIAETSNPHIEAIELDLSRLKSVRNFVAEFAASNAPPLKAIVCNAGIQIVTGTTRTEDGFETTFAINHLGHFLLVNLLLGHLSAPARIVFVSSGTHDAAQWTGMPAPNYRGARSLALPGEKPDGADEDAAATDGRRAYTTSKLCNVMCAYELSRRLRAEGLSSTERPITVNAFDPGLMPGTALARDYGMVARMLWNFVLPALTLFVPQVNSTRKSGKALASLVLDPNLVAVTATYSRGKYFGGTMPIRSSVESYDEKKAGELWETSAELVRLRPEETILKCNAPTAA